MGLSASWTGFWVIRLRADDERAVILHVQTCPSRAGSGDAPLVMGKEARRGGARRRRRPRSNQKGDRQAGGAAPGQDRQLYEQVFNPVRGTCRCAGDGTFIAQDRAATAARAVSGSPPRSERRES